VSTDDRRTTLTSRNRVAAGGAAAVVALGAGAEGVARFAGHGGEEASHIRIHDPGFPPPKPPHGGGLPGGEGSGVGSVADRLHDEAKNDADTKKVMCTAFTFFDEFNYDPETDGPDNAADFADFLTWAGHELDQTSRSKAQNI
jgi:hypothetical protein